MQTKNLKEESGFMQLDAYVLLITAYQLQLSRRGYRFLCPQQILETVFPGYPCNHVSGVSL